MLRPVLIVDDHPLFARGLALLLQQGLGLDSLIEPGCEPALRRLAAGERFIAVLLDLELPGMSGLEGLARIRAAAPELPVVVCSSHQAEAARQAARQRGAAAFVFKGDPPETLLATLSRALRSTGTAAAVPAAQAGALTARQLEVLVLMAQGKSNKVVARSLDMSENTVRNHVAAILERLGVANRHEAGEAARRLGLL